MAGEKKSEVSNTIDLDEWYNYFKGHFEEPEGQREEHGCNTNDDFEGVANHDFNMMIRLLR